MEKFTKITVGFVAQTYEKNEMGNFICTGQEFVAGDQVDYENADGNTVTPPEHEYQPFEMRVSDKANQQKKSGLGILEACKVLTSYTMDLLYRLDDQVNLSDIEELQQARDAIENYTSAEIPDKSQQFEMMLREQSPDFPSKAILLSLLAENGQFWMRPEGYGEKCTMDGEGSPVGMEIWQGRLRLIAFTDINSEGPQIIDLENAREDIRAS